MLISFFIMIEVKFSLEFSIFLRTILVHFSPTYLFFFFIFHSAGEVLSL